MEAGGHMQAMDILVPVSASVIMALLTLVGGEAIGRTDAVTTLPPSTATLDPATGIDPRDSVVANGWVTPWMERANAPDPSVTP